MKDNFKIRAFITGVYRSGTTLVSRMLANHPRLWVTYDSVHFMRFSYGRYDPIYEIKNAERLITETYARIYNRWGMRFVVDGVISDLRKFKKIDYNHIYDLIMEALISEYKKGVIGWGEKTNVCWGQIPNFLKMFPSGKTIHVIRDPRDVMCSYREMTYEPDFSYLDSAFCSLSSFLKASEYSQRFKNQNYYLLKYENLVQNPIGVTRNICSFLDLKFDSLMLDAAKFKDKSGNQWDGESSFDKKLDTISKKPIGRWKKKATPFEVFFVELINSEVMKRFGYELSGKSISKTDRINLRNILDNNKLLSQRYRLWMKTGEGVEAYPSDPLSK